MTIKHDILSVLEKTKFPKNTGRKNNLHKGQTHSLSMVLGTVKMLFGRGLAESRHNKKHPELLELAKKLLASHDPQVQVRGGDHQQEPRCRQARGPEQQWSQLYHRSG